jgi:hypothetical protein
MIGRAKGVANKGVQRSHKVARLPAPVGGIDTRQSLGEMNPNNCIYTFNLQPYEYGMRVRRGYREWQTGIEETVESTLGVHTIVPFDAVSSDPADNRLFVVTNEGIWDATDYDGTPSQVAVFADQTEEAGYGTFTQYVDQAERDVMFYADSLNGLWTYDAATDLWVNTGTLSNLDETTVNFVMSHKNNVWFGVRDSTIGYYLPILASSGDVSPQYFGDKFQHGGALQGLFSWSVDGGDGLDDILVAVSKAGDVVVYAGSGPDATDWGMKGIYFIGEIPNSSRFGTEQGGELYLLSSYGITSLNDLLQGVDSSALQADISGTSMAYRIAGLIREKMKRTISDRGWGIALVPSEGGVLVTSPTPASDAPIQYYYNRATKGWGIWRDVPMECFAESGDAVFFGTEDGRLCKMDVDIDNILLNPPTPAFNGDDIEFSILTAYTSLAADAIYKRVKLIRPDFISVLPPSHSSLTRYDFDTAEGLNFNLNETTGLPIGTWDVAEFEAAIWGSRTGVTYPTIGGAWGYGRYVAIATKGSSRSDTRLIGWDLVFDVGGPML